MNDKERKMQEVLFDLAVALIPDECEDYDLGITKALIAETKTYKSLQDKNLDEFDILAIYEAMH